MNYKFGRKRDDIIIRIAAMLPKRLRYWILMLAVRDATTGAFSNTVVPELTAIECCDRFARIHGID